MDLQICVALNIERGQKVEQISHIKDCECVNFVFNSELLMMDTAVLSINSGKFLVKESSLVICPVNMSERLLIF